jgi:uncharacterized protein YjiK
MKFLLFILLSGSILIQCSKDDVSLNPETLSLSFVDVLDIPIEEPSGLSLGKSNQSLWVVSDSPVNEIYEISLGGKLLQKLDFKGEDLEGIVFDSLKNVVWVAEEKKREIIEIALDGTELSRYSINIDNTDNNGLEGIAIDQSRHMWIANEKNPGALLSLKDDFSILNMFLLNVAKDYSGICADELDNRIWMVSDESRLLFQYDVDTDIVRKYNLPYDKAEGIAVNTEDNLIYVVRESTSQLFVYEY